MNGIVNSVSTIRREWSPAQPTARTTDAGQGAAEAISLPPPSKGIVPTVSVIISAFNRPQMLAHALASVCNQTYRALEIIVQDDSTNEESESVVIAARDARISYVRNSPSLGTAANLLAGYRKATGTYFCTLNDDDLFAPDYLERMVAPLEENANISVAFSDLFIIDVHGSVLHEQTRQTTHAWRRSSLPSGTIDDAFELALVYRSIPAMLAVFRRSVIDLDDFPPEVSVGYDFWLSYLAVRDGSPVYYTHDRLAYYRSHEGSQTAAHATPSKRLDFAHALQYMHERFLADERLESIHPRLLTKLVHDYGTAGFAHLRMNQRRSAFREFAKAVRARPSLRAVAGLILLLVPARILRHALADK